MGLCLLGTHTCLEVHELPFQLSCSQHEGAGKFALMQWDGKAQAFKKVKDWTGPNDPKAIRTQIVESAAKYAEENKITPKKCT